jgi:hypothetical protein
LAIPRRLKNIRILWQGTALRMVFFAATSHRAHLKARVLLGDRKIYHALPSLLKGHLGDLV